ncbi:MAG: 1-(5-phosphoribosyl)-5-[(5-phosphoribosylamino)methylideneamino]imidazole-4-carboxamide isomerase [Endomicrobiales bacterium]|nr:1-(5-phosphoribosyl)-5-[(5-phosphoribosylamino)methylideneamino]imidazole-4-carboxamide isomerase [Endomicrobiales bacterium]
MLVIPAIDIRAGNCVMLTQGKIEDETIYSKDPVFIAKLWQAKGAKRLHVVDLDGAFQGAPKNIEILKKIRESVSIPIQFGGGVRSLENIEKLIGLGINYVILGTIAVYNPDLLRKAFSRYNSKIIIALDVRDNIISIGGWKETTTVNACDFVKDLTSMGIKEAIFTDIKKDGTLQGPNIKALREIAKCGKLKIIASGGISNIKDVKEVKKLESIGISGVIIGKALYTDDIKLEEAIKEE